MPIWLSRSQVRGLYRTEELFDLVQQAYQNRTAAGIHVTPRNHTGYSGRAEKGPSLKMLGAAAAHSGGLVGHLYTGGFAQKGAVRALWLWFDAQNGELLMVADVEDLMVDLPATVSLVATQALAPKTGGWLGVIGSGRQARAHVLALAPRMEAEGVRIYSRSAEHRREAQEALAARLPCVVEAVDDPRGAVEGMRVVVTATTSPVPVFDGRWLEPGMHVNAIGCHYPATSELDDRTLAAADVVVVDDRGQALEEYGEIQLSLASGALDRRRLLTLSEVLEGTHPGRTRPSAITLFKSGGCGLEAWAVASWLYQRALSSEVGQHLD